MDLLAEIFSTCLTPIVFLYMAAGVLCGICIGALPGLTATMGVALLLPMTFGMDAAQGILMLIGIYCGAIYGGSISAVLLHTPGTPASAATAIDGYAMAKKGEAGRALGAATLASYIGGLVSVLCLWLISPQLAKLALVATIGIDSVTSYIRFSPEGNFNFMGGINYIPIMIGLFAMSQAFENIETIFTKEEIEVKLTNILPKKEDLKKIFRIAPVTGLIGTFIGIIPGAGADIGSFVGYNTARSIAKEPELFGKGSVEAVSGPEGGNNGVTGGAMIPMLTLGVPGDAVTAIMIGALTIQGLAPGPMLFETNEALVYSIFLGMFVANTLMCIFGFAGIRLFTKVLSVPKGILTPIIFVLCIIGSFAMKNSLFDVWVMLVAGIVGYFLGKVKVPTSPAILGLILGPMAEKNFRTALLKSGGDPSVFFDSVICWFFIALIAISLFGGYIKKALMSRGGSAK